MIIFTLHFFIGNYSGKTAVENVIMTREEDYASGWYT